VCPLLLRYAGEGYMDKGEEDDKSFEAAEKWREAPYAPMPRTGRHHRHDEVARGLGKCAYDEDD
jgi:hypothetical protein